jgi:transcriptional regulator with GAF, ATPase, and Fis domain
VVTHDFASHAGVEAAFSRIAAAAFPFLQHDEGFLAIFSSDRRRVDCLLTTRGYEGEICRQKEAWILDNAETPSFGVADIDGEGRLGWLKAPVLVGGTLAGVVAFVSRNPAQYSAADVEPARWVAELASSLTKAGRLPLPESLAHGVSSGFDPSEALLHEIGHVLDVRDVFPRISEIVNTSLPHDRLTMTFHQPDGHIGFEAGSTPNSERQEVNVDPRLLARPFVLLPDLSPEALAHFGTIEAREFLLASGFGSFLAVNLTAGTQRLGVEFWSKARNAFGVGDVTAARRIGHYIALAVAHKRLAEAAQEDALSLSAERRLEERVRTLSETLTVDAKRRRRMLTESKSWAPILRAAAQVAETDSTVLLLGESGTGKEVIAQFIHAASKRRRAPFVAVNCAALPEQLIESELFGHERGAFSGAMYAKPGQIELAAGGVLFLDEVAEMSMCAQAKLLRVLQEREFRRLGGTRVLTADIRLIAATNVDLQHAIRAGRFRRDLYYRLRVFDLRLPPLRERSDDIAKLSEILLEEIGESIGRPAATLTAAARSALVNYDWPGNVRELRNVLERASIVCDRGIIAPAQLSFDGDETESGAFTTHLGTLEREVIEKVLEECGGNKSRAAKRLGLSRMQLYVRLRRYQIDEAAN